MTRQTTAFSMHATVRIQSAIRSAYSKAIVQLRLRPIFALMLTFCPLHYAFAQQKRSAIPDPFQPVQTLIDQHRYAEAKTQTLDLLKIHSTSVTGYNLLGVIEVYQKDYKTAFSSFQKAMVLNPNSSKTHNDIGNLYVVLKDYDAAEKQFRSVLRVEPANPDANYNLGLLLMMKGEAAAAIPHFERVRASSTAARFNLVKAYLQTGRSQAALQEASRLSEQAASDVQVHFSLGTLLASEKQYKAAKLEFEKADVLRPGTFEILYNLGQDLLRDGQTGQAEMNLNRALTLKPDSVDTMYLLAQCHISQSRPLDALDLLLKAHKLAPNNADVIFLMAKVSMSQNYYEDAIPLLEDGLRIAPQRPDLIAALGESYFMAGKVEKAIDQFTKLVQLDGSARSYAFLGVSYRNIGRFDEARTYFQKGLKLDSHNSLCLFNLGFIAEREGDAAAAEDLFQQALKYNPEFADALLELANLRTAAKRLPEAADLLRRFVRVSRDPSTGYYKLAMVERSLHQDAEADRDLDTFKTMSKNVPGGPYPYEHLFDYLDTRSQLPSGARNQLDINELLEQTNKHPDQPEDLYMLAETYLKSGRIGDAREAVSKLDKLSAGDFRTLSGTGVLLGRYHLYDDAIQHFQAALAINPNSDDVRFDLANALFGKRSYSAALEAAQQISEAGRQDGAYLTLLADIYSHLGDGMRASDLFKEAITRNPDNDQNYVSLALLQLRSNDPQGAQLTLSRGQALIPGSGKIFWAMGLIAVLEDNSQTAVHDFERAVDLLPEWSGAYSTLGVFYFQTGKIEKAKEVLNRFKESSAKGGLEVGRIEQILDSTSTTAVENTDTLNSANKAQFLQLALSLADRTL